MITKFFLRLFVPYRWTIIKEAGISVSRRDPYTYYGGTVPHCQGTQYTLQNQYGDIKFKTVWYDGRQGVF